MKLSEAREFIDKLYNSEDGFTDDMREDLRRLHDSEDEQEGVLYLKCGAQTGNH